MLIEAEDLVLTYHDGEKVVHAVDHVSLELPKTGFIGILGPSGSGKTSLLYLLSGIKRPVGGRLTYLGKKYPSSMAGLSQLRRQKMGFVFQQHFLINYLTVLENIWVGACLKTQATQNLIASVIEAVELTGLEGRKPYQLSGGQRQRVAIARALANNPEIIFVDEPTASLDHRIGRKIVDLLYERAKSVCVVTVTHDVSILDRASCVFKMWDGRLTQNQ